MIDLFAGEKMVLAIFFLIAAFFWGIAGVYHLYLFWAARRVYKESGGNAAATKEISRAAVQTAYDNREVVKEVIVENKDTIKQVVVDNKDTIIDFAKEHKQEIAHAVIENRDVVNPWENAEVMNSVFSEKK